MLLLQLNTTLNSGSTGRMAEDIGRIAISSGHRSFIAAGYVNRPSQSEVIPIGSSFDRMIHGLKTRLLDMHGFGSEQATVRFIDKVKVINPDVIHLHNIHGYYMHAGVLFEYLKKSQKPVIWTLHDCWPFTGHCSHYQFVDCKKWQKECFDCPLKRRYPKSWIIDNSTNNFRRKKGLFTGLDNLTIVTPSLWLSEQLRDSFLNQYRVKVINNGVDLELFRPNDPETVKRKLNLKGRKTIIGVASTWTSRKGLNDFIGLRKLMDRSIDIILVGLNVNQIASLPDGICGILRTENVVEMASLYSLADVLVNPTYVDNFPSVNIEALACGTPVVTYSTGGCPEAIDNNTGLIVEKSNLNQLKSSIDLVLFSETRFKSNQCRERAIEHFSALDRFGDYIKLYESLYSES